MRKADASIIKRSITCFTQSETVYEKSVSSKVKRFPRWHSKSPASVSLDNSMSDAAFRIYCTMGLKTKGNTCCVGVRKLGKLLGKSATTVSRRIKELVAAKHLELVKGGDGRRAMYRFTSPAYLKTCKQCKAFTGDISATGLCWLCEEHRVAKERTA